MLNITTSDINLSNSWAPLPHPAAVEKISKKSILVDVPNANGIKRGIKDHLANR